MSNLRTIHDAITGEITTIELTDSELAERSQATKDAKAYAAADAPNKETLGIGFKNDMDFFHKLFHEDVFHCPVKSS